MRRYRPFLLLGLASIIAFSTSSMVYRWLRAQAESTQASVQAEVKTVPVAVANLDIPRGSTITAEMVKTSNLPPESLPAGTFAAEELASLVGRIAVVDLAMNELVLQGKLAAVDASGGVAALLDPTKRAMSVRVDEEVGVAGFVKPTDRVDLFVTLETEATETEPATIITKLVLANTPVLATGTELVRAGKDEEASPVRVITLEVTPEDGEKLALASTQGKFRLALRSPLSKDVVLTRGATVESLLSSFQGNPAQVEEEGGAGAEVELIRGSAVSSVSF